MEKSRQSSLQDQRGCSGIFFGIVFGLIIGLAIAIVIALYLREAPTPFLSKGNIPESTFSTVNNSGSFNLNRLLDNNLFSQEKTSSTAFPIPNIVPSEIETSSPLTSVLPEEPQIIEIPSTTSVTTVTEQPKPEKSLKRDETQASDLVSSSCIGNKPTFIALAKPSAVPQNLDSSSNVNTAYFLQVGAYQTKQDAEQKRAELELQRFESKITQRNVGEVVYYRVRIGPFSSFEDEDMNNLHHRLSVAGIDTIVIRVAKQ
ncbi:SPOR domain-containing protein [Candidatus Vallotia lariciata]|uniref:SPOR domain-containing protein n=1 Tax=Candidatus Vallotia laricis TaxID=2018052 RepID=UPI001D01189B|nr:SPOR domain-containing protein [Candidatus Vallotia lariciata]UDG83342.1 Cell division protein FtsN [Candidatus Vallotia lariciata]